MCVLGCVGGYVGSTRCRGAVTDLIRTGFYSRRWACSISWIFRVACCGRKHAAFVRELDAANPHVQFDEREVETGPAKRHRQPVTIKGRLPCERISLTTAPPLDSTAAPTHETCGLQT